MISPETRLPHAPPSLLGVYGLIFLLAVTLIAARLSAPIVALLAGSLLLVGLLARVWARFALSGLTYTRQATVIGGQGSGARGRETTERLASRPPTPRPPAPDPRPLAPGPWPPAVRAFCGDTLLLETRLGNRKLLPLPWVEAWERLPFALEPEDLLVESLEMRAWGWLCQGATLWPYQRARWQHRLDCRHRGVFTLGAVRARAGDPFGVGEREAVLPARLEVIVYPRVVPLRRLGLPLRHPTLDVASRRGLVTDPTRTAWLRPYQPGDPQRLVHWPATARQGSLQVRVAEPTTSLQVSLVLDAASFDTVLMLYRETLFELAISALASIAVHLQQAGYPVGFFTNAQPAVTLPPSANPAQLPTLLEWLARIGVGPGPRGLGPDGALASASAARTPLPPIPRSSAVILAASELAHDLPHTLARLEQAGHQVVVLLAGSGYREAPIPPRHVVQLSPRCDLAAVLEEHDASQRLAR